MAQIALVTGGNRGIGYEVCRQLADEGFQVLLTGRSLNRGEEAAAALRSQGLRVEYLRLDVTDRDAIGEAASSVRDRFGRLDVLVNNAAVYLDEGVSVFDVSLDTLRLTMETNFYGPLQLCRVFIPLMQRQRYGRVVNVSSGGGALTGMSGRTAAYKISKTALNALTRILADEVSEYDIKVNAVCPGWVNTDMGGPAAPRSVQQAADTIVWLATLPADGPSGGFFRDRKPIDW